MTKAMLSVVYISGDENLMEDHFPLLHIAGTCIFSSYKIMLYMLPQDIFNLASGCLYKCC